MKITVRAVIGMKFRWDLSDFSDEEKEGKRIEQLATWGNSPNQNQAIREGKLQAASIRRAARHHRIKTEVVEV